MKEQVLCGQINPIFPEQEHLKCPRCDSSNTKFCYFNNYNLSQPRHYCKNCKRYWTKGGVLRNIPIGGGSRKNTKRSSTARKGSCSSSMAAAGTEASSSLKVEFDQDHKMLDLNVENFGGHLGSFNEEQIGNSMSELTQLDEGNKNVGSGTGSDECREMDQENSFSTTSRCWNNGNWPDLAL